MLGLVAVDVLLVGAALHKPGSSDSVAAVGTATLPTPSGVQHATAAATAVTPHAPSRPPGLLSASSSTSAWRAVGGCSAKPALRATSDGGGTWTTLTSPAPHLLRITMTGAETGWVIGANGACTPTYYSTTDGGATWAAAPTLGKVWVPEAVGVRTPKGAHVTPCGTGTGVSVLAPATAKTAMVVCPTGVSLTTDGGTAWSVLTTLPHGHPLAAAMSGGKSGVVLLAKAPHCAGLRSVATTDGGTTWSSGQCLTGALRPAMVSLTTGGSGLVVSSGRDYATTTAGTSWA